MEECYFLLKVAILNGCFLRFLNCANGTKLCKETQIKFIFLPCTLQFLKAKQNNMKASYWFS